MSVIDVVATGPGTMARLEASGGSTTLLELFALAGAPASNLVVRLHPMTPSGQVILDLASSAAILEINGQAVLSLLINSLISSFPVAVLGSVTASQFIPSSLITAYVQTYATATRIHSAPTATALTAATGTADGTVQDVSGGFDQTILNNNFKDLATAVNALIADLANVKQVLNQVINDGRTLGLLQ